MAALSSVPVSVNVVFFRPCSDARTRAYAYACAGVCVTHGRSA